MQERALPGAAERGFALLRDRDRLRSFLRRHVPAASYQASSRYALPLSEQPEPPHLLVTGDGYGVTCLASGMAVAAHSCGWEDVSQFIDAEKRIFRAQMEANQLDASEGANPLERMTNAPWSISEEDMRALALLAPLFVDVAKAGIIYASDALQSVRNQRVKWTTKSVGAFWQMYWGAAHWLMTCAALPDALPWAYALVVNAHDVHLSARALWVLVHDAERGLRATEEIATQHESLCAGACRFVLPAIAIRHPARAKDAAKMARTLLQSNPVAAPEAIFESIVSLQDASATLGNLENALWDTWPLAFQEAWKDGKIQAPVVDRQVPARSETLGAGQAWRALLQNRKRPLLMVDDPYFPLLTALVTRDALVPPYADDFPIHRRPGATYVSEILTPMLRNRFVSDRSSGVSVKQVGRNEGCPCGSGRKYKHCHGKQVT